MFELNLTLVIFLVSFLLFLYLFDAWCLRPVGSTIELRTKKIQADIDTGKALRQESERLLDSYHRHLEKIRQEAQAIVADAVEKAGDERRQAIEKLRSEGRARIEAARQAIADERLELVDSLVEQEVELVEMICQKLTGQNQAVTIDPEKVHRALEETC